MLTGIYGFELSGEDEKLPEAEVIALFETYGAKIKGLNRLNRLLLVEVDWQGRSDLLSEFTARIALSHVVIEVSEVTDADPDKIKKNVLKISPMIRGSYAVDAKVWNNPSFRSVELERSVGALLYHEGVWVDLKNPDVIIKLYIIGKTCVLGKIVYKRSKREFSERIPHLRPFFSPGVLKPQLARAIVNLCCIKPSQRLLDPFVGTGGILLEAGLMGIACLGIDVQERMVLGASNNLEALDDVNLMLGDARSLPFKNSSIEGIVTDPPYGRSSRIKGDSLDSLYRDALSEIFRVLKSGCYAVIIADKPVSELIDLAGFLVIAEYRIRVHRSMTRRIYVMKKSIHSKTILSEISV